MRYLYENLDIHVKLPEDVGTSHERSLVVRAEYTEQLDENYRRQHKTEESTVGFIYDNGEDVHVNLGVDVSLCLSYTQLRWLASLLTVYNLHTGTLNKFNSKEVRRCL